MYSDNPSATAIYNQQKTTSLPENSLNATAAIASTIGAGSQSMPGYLVDLKGNIQFQAIGSVQVEGLTKAELAEILKEKLSKYLKNPYCNIRFLNYKITILGEVTRQGVYSVASERINVLEALGMAGDITMYGLKDSIMVVREINGRRTFGNLDVSNPQSLLSPYYNLHQNDIIIVKASSKKPTVSDQATTRNLAFVATVATIVTSISVLLNIILR
ncbi:MAG: polysaccharide biosynthesis/export family protein [Chitinophagaceae bacterium]|nr:polysaccharide biosynthesis/export family protein [Chitinophagaceae bacterium]